MNGNITSKSTARMFIVFVAILCTVIMLAARAFMDAAIAFPVILALGLIAVELFWKEEPDED
jgi:Flp pilus assembly protein TadB